MHRTCVRLRRRRLVALIGASSLVLALWGPAARALGGPQGAERGARYVVASGDTLWSIARSHAEPGADPRPLVAAIVEANAIDADIVPGQALVIPTGA
jgi:nucleoid-associated protein YgaU